MRLSRYCILLSVNLVVASGSALAQKANLHADIGNLIVRHQTEHYAIAGTISDDRLLEYGRCLEFIYREYATGFATLTATDDVGTDKKSAEAVMKGSYGNRFPVIIFAKDDEYDQFGTKYFPESLEHTRGVFLRSLKLLVIRDDSDTAQTYEVLFHEAFHQFASRYVPSIPIWANEGLATYYGHARPTSTGLRFDRPSAGHFKTVQAARDAKALIPLSRLLGMNQAQFYGGEKVANLDFAHRTLCYAQAYTLVSYILSDPAGATHLRDYLKELMGAKSRSAEESITKRFFDSKTLETLTPQWLLYCQKY